MTTVGSPSEPDHWRLEPRSTDGSYAWGWLKRTSMTESSAWKRGTRKAQSNGLSLTPEQQQLDESMLNTVRQLVLRRPMFMTCYPRAHEPSTRVDRGALPSACGVRHRVGSHADE